MAKVQIANRSFLPGIPFLSHYYFVSQASTTFSLKFLHPQRIVFVNLAPFRFNLLLDAGVL